MKYNAMTTLDQSLVTSGVRILAVLTKDEEGKRQLSFMGDKAVEIDIELEEVQVDGNNIVLQIWGELASITEVGDLQKVKVNNWWYEVIEEQGGHVSLVSRFVRLNDVVNATELTEAF